MRKKPKKLFCATLKSTQNHPDGNKKSRAVSPQTALETLKPLWGYIITIKLKKL